jgi:hypothetical protein
MRVFLSFFRCPSRSIAYITAVNGKTGIDNLLLVIYQRYFFFFRFLFSHWKPYLVRNDTKALAHSAKRSPNDFVIIIILLHREVFIDRRVAV